jgi:hypothetical protein
MHACAGGGPTSCCSSGVPTPYSALCAGPGQQHRITQQQQHDTHSLGDVERIVQAAGQQQVAAAGELGKVDRVHVHNPCERLRGGSLVASQGMRPYLIAQFSRTKPRNSVTTHSPSAVDAANSAPSGDQQTFQTYGTSKMRNETSWDPKRLHTSLSPIEHRCTRWEGRSKLLVD